MQHRSHAFGVRGALIAAIACVGGCNTRTPLHDRPVFVTAPTEWLNPSAPAAPGGDLATVELSPMVMIGSGGGRGTVFLDGPASQDGLAVTLSSELSRLVTVTPSIVTIPAGSFSAGFSYTTTSVMHDVDISITASTAARSRSARLSVWAAVLPSVYFHIADEDDLIRGGPTFRATSDSGARFHVSCTGNVFHPTVTPPRSSTHGLTIAAAGGQPLRPGVYENATSSGSGHHLRIDNALSCASIGRFEVREVRVHPSGGVRNLWIAFEVGCPGRPGIVRGEYRVTDQAPFGRAACAGG